MRQQNPLRRGYRLLAVLSMAAMVGGCASTFNVGETEFACKEKEGCPTPIEVYEATHGNSPEVRMGRTPKTWKANAGDVVRFSQDIRATLPSMGWFGSGSNTGRADRNNGFYNWVMYSAPLVYMLRLLDEDACAPDGLLDFDVINMSPLFPNWNDVVGRYAAFMNPESMFLGSVTALATMPIDAMSTIVHDKPLNHLHWAAGQWGMLYPITGFDESSSTSDTVRFSSLIAARSMALMHRLGLLRDTVGKANLCERKVQPIMRKDAFRWQMVAPSPEYKTIPAAGGNGATVRMIDRPHGRGTCTHPTGLPTPLWGMWRNVPATGEDHSYMVFQYTDCCFGITPSP